MKFFIRVFLSYALVLGSMAPYAVKAQMATESLSKHELARMLMSPVDMFNSQFNRSGIYIEPAYPLDGPRVVNEYRLLGLSDPFNGKDSKLSITSDTFKEALRNRNFIFDSSPEQLKNHPEFQRMQQTTEGRAALLRMQKGGFAALSVVTGENLNIKTEDAVRRITQEVLSDKSYDDKDIRVRSEKRQIEINRRLLNEFPEEQRLQARARIEQARHLLSNPQIRARYNFANGFASGQVPPRSSNFSLTNQYRNVRGQMVVRVKDPFGKDVDISLPRSASELKESKLRGSTLFKDLSSKKVIQGGALLIAIGIIIYASSEYAMIRDYENNPRRFEETLEQTSSAALYSSVFSFFVGGWATDKAFSGAVNYLDVARKSKANIHSLVQNKNMFVNNPELKSKFIKSNMATLKSSSFLARATSYPGMTGGFLISQLVYRYVDKLESCRKVPYLKSGKYTPAERTRVEQSCDQTVSQIMQEIASSPQTWVALVSMLSAKALLTLGMKGAQRAKYAFASNKNAMTALKASKAAHEVRITPRGLLKAPKVMGVLGGTVGGIIIFSLIFWGVSEALNWGVSRLTLNVPATQAAENIRELFRRYQAAGWDMGSLCDDRSFLQGGLLDYIRPLWTEKTNRCADELVNAFLENHELVNKNWRQSLRAPVDDPNVGAITKWAEFIFKSTNLQKATYLFYKDIAEQIKAQRNSGKIIKFTRVENQPNGHTKEALGYANTHLYNHPLPLFRSEPYFGWSYKLDSDGTTDIPYPVYDGEQTNWQERLNTRYGVNWLTQRKDHFKNAVLPEVIKLLEERHAEIQNENEKTKITRILGYLKNKNGVQTLSNIARGLYLISRQMEQEENTFNCLAFGKECFWINLQKKFVDKDIWSEDKEGRFVFMEGIDYYAGYQTNPAPPVGVKPVGPGQEFFIKYFTRLSNNDVDPYYFEEGYASMTDYLLKNMVCGVDVVNGEKMFVSRWSDNLPNWMKLNPHRAPEFQAPKISLKPGFNPCNGDILTNMWRRSVLPQAVSFYNYIEDSRDPQLSYGGIVEFLYKHAEDDFVQDFDSWWKKYVEPQFSEVVDKLYSEHFKAKVIDEQLKEIITADNTDNNCFEQCVEFNFAHKKGLAAAIKQEMDTYFTYFYAPLIKEANMDLNFADGITDQNTARQKLSADFIKLRSELYDIFGYASERLPRLTIPSLINEYQDLLENVEAEATVQNPEINPNYEIIKLRALATLFSQKLYEMRILMKTDESQYILEIYTTAVKLLNEMTHLNEFERDQIRQNIVINTNILAEEFESQENRNGKVLLDYNDWPEDENELSPTLKVVSKTQDTLTALMNELLEAQAQKNIFK